MDNQNIRYERRTLSGGVPVYFILNPQSTNLYMSVDFAAGSAHERANEYGAAHALEHAFFLGTETRDQAALYNAGRQWGKTGSRNAATSETSLMFNCLNAPHTYGGPVAAFNGTNSVSLVTQHARAMVDHLSDLLLRPCFPSDLSAEEFRLIANEIGWSHDRPEQYFDNHVAPHFFEAPYSHSVAALKEDVMKLTLSDLLAFRDRYVGTSNMSVWVCGPDMPVDEITAYLDQGFAAMPAAEKAAPLVCRLREGDIRVSNPFYQQNHIDILLAQPYPRTPEEEAHRYMARLLVGDGLNSQMRLQTPASYSYGISYLEEPGMLAYRLSAYPGAEDTAACARILLDTVSRAREWVTEETFEGYRQSQSNLVFPLNARDIYRAARDALRLYHDVSAISKNAIYANMRYEDVLPHIDDLAARPFGTACTGPVPEAMPTLEALRTSPQPQALSRYTIA